MYFDGIYNLVVECIVRITLTSFQQSGLPSYSFFPLTRISPKAKK